MQGVSRCRCAERLLCRWRAGRLLFCRRVGLLLFRRAGCLFWCRAGCLLFLRRAGCLLRRRRVGCRFFRRAEGLLVRRRAGLRFCRCAGCLLCHRVGCRLFRWRVGCLLFRRRVGRLFCWRAGHLPFRLPDGSLRVLRRERPGHEGTGGIVGGGVLKGDGTVRDRLGTAAGLDEELGQMSAQPDVVGSGLYGTCQGCDKGIGHTVSVDVGSGTNAGENVWNVSRAVHRVTCPRTDLQVENLLTLRS